MQRYNISREGDLMKAEGGYVYLASEVEARIAELEKRLVACEGAMLLGCDAGHKAIHGYMTRYPDPYLPTSHP